MEETVMLILLVVVMLIGSYIAGSIPLIVNLSEEKLTRITVFGSGLLVGTALAVIIPEGIRSLSLNRTQNRSVNPVNSGKPIESADDEPWLSVIGISLVLGFVFMLLVDQIANNSANNAGSNASVAYFSGNRVLKRERNVTATIGLVVHAAADGVALGAAATTSHAEVEIIVFLAIMLHKAPAAFGLVTFLLHEGVDRQRIRKHLLIFALSAPTLTVITYFGIGQEGKEKLSTFNATGIAMLFSAGTFLYVATVHVLAELTHSHSHSATFRQSEDKNDDAELPLSSNNSGNTGVKYGLSGVELLILVVGCVTPVFLTLGHSHSH